MEVQNEKKKSVALVGCVLNFTLQVSVLLEIMNGLNFFPLSVNVHNEILLAPASF